MRSLGLARHVFILCALGLQVACGSSGDGGHSNPGPGTPGPGPTPRPAPAPRPAPEVETSVLSELSPSAVETVHACFLGRWSEARDSWEYMAGAYLISCVTESVTVSERDWTPQFERHFVILFSALQDQSAKPLPRIQGEAVLEQLKKGVSL